MAGDGKGGGGGLRQRAFTYRAPSWAPAAYHSVSKPSGGGGFRQSGTPSPGLSPANAKPPQMVAQQRLAALRRVLPGFQQLTGVPSANTMVGTALKWPGFGLWNVGNEFNTVSTLPAGITNRGAGAQGYTPVSGGVNPAPGTAADPLRVPGGGVLPPSTESRLSGTLSGKQETGPEAAREARAGIGALTSLWNPRPLVSVPMAVHGGSGDKSLIPMVSAGDPVGKPIPDYRIWLDRALAGRGKF